MTEPTKPSRGRVVLNVATLLWVALGFGALGNILRQRFGLAGFAAGVFLFGLFFISLFRRATGRPWTRAVAGALPTALGAAGICYLAARHLWWQLAGFFLLVLAAGMLNGARRRHAA